MNGSSTAECAHSPWTLDPRTCRVLGTDVARSAPRGSGPMLRLLVRLALRGSFTLQRAQSHGRREHREHREAGPGTVPAMNAIDGLGSEARTSLFWGEID